MSITEPEGREASGVAPTMKPVVLPEMFDGTREWDEWCFHFENVASVGQFSETKVAPSSADRARSESAPSPHGNPKGIVCLDEGRFEVPLLSRKSPNAFPSGVPDPTEEGE